MNVEKAENFLVKILHLGIAVILFLPLALMGSFGITPYDESSKAVLFQCAVEAILWLYLCLVLLDKKYLPGKSGIWLALAGFYFMEIVSSLQGVNFYQSFFGNLGRMDGIVLHLHLLAFFVIASSLLLRRKDWMIFLKISAVVSGFVALAGFVQRFSEFRMFGLDVKTRISGTLVNPDVFGNYIALSLFVVAFLAFYEKNRKAKIFWIFLALFDLLALFFSGTRGSWAGAFAGFFLVFVLTGWNWIKRKERITKKTIFIVFFVLLAMAGILFSAYKLSDRLKEKNDMARRVHSVFTFQLDNGRKSLWQSAFKIFLQSPILGHGVDSFGFVSEKYAESSGENSIYYKLASDRVHNKFLEVMVSGGILGLVLYLLIFFLIFRKIIKNRENLFVAGFFVCYLGSNLTLFDSMGSYLPFFMMLGFLNSKDQAGADNQEPIAGKIAVWKQTAMFASLAVVLLIFWNLNVRTALAGMYLREGVSSEPVLVEGAIYCYEKTLEQKSYYDYGYRMLVLSRVDSIFEVSGKEIKKTVKNFFNDMAEGLELQMEENVHQKRLFFENYAKAYGWLYGIDKNPDDLKKMEEILEKGIVFNKNYPPFYIQLARLEILRGNNEKAREFAMRFYEAGPKNVSEEVKMHTHLAQAYFEAGKSEDGLREAKTAIEKDCLDVEKVEAFNIAGMVKSVALLYVKNGEIEKAREIYLKALKCYPAYYKDWQAGLKSIGVVE